MKNNKKNEQTVEIEQPDSKEIEHHTVHPGQEEWSLQNVRFAPEENSFISGREMNGDE
ncbi:hypothetical protein [Radiobacillus sp. PE A8.2]|uniref:hypothetical protein n=1 Tax=Radiobacillus sp. PE A8.2 TaxID=3380349 RepID=UPI00388D787F